MAGPQDTTDQSESEVQIRTFAGTGPDTLVYLPGLHGDWTLIGSFRRALQGRVPFAEMTYPRTLTWSLDDYATHVEAALSMQGIRGGWILGESFGSQVAWALAKRTSFKARGVIIAGGFVSHPAKWLVRTGEAVGGNIPLSWITRMLFGYARVARSRFRKSPEVAAGINEFIARRTELDRKAAIHRLRLIFHNDHRNTVCHLALPLYALAGWIDPIVPWILVRQWLKSRCPAFREFRVIPWADHNVLGTAPDAAADIICDWLRRESAAPPLPRS